MPTFTRRTRLLFTGTDLIPPENSMLTNGSSLTLSAAPVMLIVNPSPPPPNNQFCFMFWNVKDELHATPSTSIANVGSSAFTGSAWYRNCNPNGGGPAAISVAAFSVPADQFLPGTPIQAVTPAGAWAGGNSTVVNPASGPVTITAKSEMNNLDFGGWLIFGAGTSGGGTTLNVPQNGSTFAIAQYRTPESTGPGNIHVDIFEFIERVRWRHEGDPSPVDLLRITDRFINQQQRQSPARQAPADDLSALTSRIHTMNAQELRLALADLQSREGRLAAARKMAEEALRKQSGGK